jgi:UDP-N-acetylmuramoylalanine--D-glutamate ligase
LDKNIDLLKIKSISILGDGKTAQSLKKKLDELKIFQIVSENQVADLTIISPGLNPKEYSSITSPIISEIDFSYLLFKYFKKIPILIAITGTNGKTTTTDLISQLLNIPVAGNIGKPLIDYVSPNHKKVPDMISLEVSSYQLETSYHIKPDVYIVLNITKDHLERHKTIKNYSEIKLSPLERLSKNDCFIYNSKDKLTSDYLEKINIKANLLDLKDTKEIKNLLKKTPLLGKHNVDNLSAAIKACFVLKRNITSKDIEKIKPYPHRLEIIKTINDILFINDSKATNPDSTIAGIKALSNRNIILLLGGERKKVSYQKMINLIKEKNIKIISFGKCNTFFSEKFNNYSNYIGETKILEEATILAFSKAKNFDIILLSPSCASFDMYNNFEERGNEFKQIVSRIST